MIPINLLFVIHTFTEVCCSLCQISAVTKITFFVSELLLACTTNCIPYGITARDDKSITPVDAFSAPQQISPPLLFLLFYTVATIYHNQKTLVCLWTVSPLYSLVWSEFTIKRKIQQEWQKMETRQLCYHIVSWMFVSHLIMLTLSTKP